MPEVTTPPAANYSSLRYKLIDWCAIALWPAVIGFVGLLLVCLTLDPASRGTANLLDAPGFTIDENFNIQQGYFLYAAISIYQFYIIFPESLREILIDTQYLPDHPPLGRLWIGVFHALAKNALGISTQFDYGCGRVGSAFAFFFLILICGMFAGRWWGKTASITTAITVMLTPRLFGHAHLGSLEMCVNLTYTLAVLYICHTWIANPCPTKSGATNSFWGRIQSYSGVHLKFAFVAGLLWGLALLTKIQGVFVPVSLTLWILYAYRLKGVLPLAVMGITGFVVFFVCWPWLWFDPVTHLKNYLGSATDRLPINCWYMGEQFVDKKVPWHYPFAMLLLTIPLGHLFIAGFAVWQHRRESRVRYLILSLFVPLLIFALPVAKYDGERLFQFVIPLCGMLAGYGWATLYKNAIHKKWLLGVVSLCLALQGAGLVLSHPCQINHYNLVGRVLMWIRPHSLEQCYWGDGITARFMDRQINDLPEHATVYVLPILHQFQLDHYEKLFPQVINKNIKFEAGSKEILDQWQSVGKTTPNAEPPRFLLIYARLADIPDEKIQSLLTQNRLELKEAVNINGLNVANIYRVQ